MLPGQTVDAFLVEIQRVVGSDLKVTVLEQHEGQGLSNGHAALRSDWARDRAASSRRSCRAFHDPRVHRLARLREASGATCYGFSPVKMPKGMSFTALYHAHDERIPVDGFAWGLRILVDLVHEFCAAP